MAPNIDFRPNPSRSIYVQGGIYEELVDRLTPQILRLTYESREPITVYIDSNGGEPEQMLKLLRVLKASNQDFEAPCRIITVVVTRAYSAAADLLAFGDYAIAHPQSRILFHGGRLPNVSTLTAERSSFFAYYLRLANESSALDLAREIEIRFMFRFISLQSQFDNIRGEQGNSNMTDLDCFLHIISENISQPAIRILEKARARYSKYDDLVKNIIREKNKLRAERSSLEWEGVELRAIINFEIKKNQNNPDWSFRLNGLDSLVDDFLLFQSYEDVSQTDRYKRICARYGMFLVSDEEAEKINQLSDKNEQLEKWTERVSPELRPIWSFFVALCYTLQQGEDEFLTALDSYWLGLIDEVIGNSDLTHLRSIVERQNEIASETSNEIPAENSTA